MAPMSAGDGCCRRKLCRFNKCGVSGGFACGMATRAAAFARRRIRYIAAYHREPINALDYRSSLAIRLDVSQRRPPICCTSA